ncbi:MAG: hypothetical protein EOO88_48410 [Pedobacter sp.]|nr:MAG: hypothetical protein EOO88_48410 [Pedobacter sp.]
MMDYGEKLSLRKAAEFAEVSEPTMRAWAKEIPLVEKNSSGGYLIPRDELTIYLRAKAGRKFGGSSRDNAPPSSIGGQGEVLEGVKRERDRAELEVKFLQERVKELEGIVSRVSADFASLTREFIEVALRGGTPGVSRWTNQIRNQQETVDAEVITQTAVPTRAKAKPKKTSKKIPAKKPKAKVVKRNVTKKAGRKSK